MSEDEREYVARDELVELLRRIEALEQRVAELERPGRRSEGK